MTEVAADPRLSHWPVTIEIPVAWGEMDAFRHVNNVVYVRYMETARIVYFERTGMKLDTVAGDPILATQTIHYRKPIVYPDRVKVSTTITKIGTTSFVHGYRIVSEKVGLACEGESVTVWYDFAKGTKMPLSDELRDAIYRLEATGGG